MLANAQRTGLFLAFRIVAVDAVLDNLGAVQDGGVGTRVKLHRGNGDQRERDVRAARPRKVLLLLHLHGQVHGRLRALFPLHAGLLVTAVAFPDVVAQGFQLIVVKTVSQVRRVDRLFVDLQ